MLNNGSRLGVVAVLVKILVGCQQSEIFELVWLIETDLVNPSDLPYTGILITVGVFRRVKAAGY